ncbi:hypothetical protein N9Y42_09325 [Mariniblastus sp.]|nr:hypothetical protein [Mariniblastus sp.]
MTIDNPYQSPAAVAPQQASSSRSLISLVLAFLNFAASTFFAISCVVAVVAHERPFQLIGGIMFFLPLSIYALCEWMVLYRRNTSVERVLGIANIGCAGLAAFGVVTNVSEALMAEGPLDMQFIYWFSLIGGSIATYLGLSGWYRLRSTCVEESFTCESTDAT